MPVKGVTGNVVNSRNIVRSQAPKREPISTGIDPGAVSRIGVMVGEGSDRKMLATGKGYSPPQGPNFSNGSGQGPGSNHRVYPCGSQSSMKKAPTPMSGPRRSLFK